MQLDLDNDIQRAKKIRLPWWGVLCWMIGCLPVVLLLDHFERFDLARPVLYSAGMLGVAVAIKWKLRRHAWFWITMAIIAALHVLLSLLVPWNTKWVPAIVIIPIGIVDLYAMLAILAVIEKLIEGRKHYGNEDIRP